MEQEVEAMSERLREESERLATAEQQVAFLKAVRQNDICRVQSCFLHLLKIAPFCLERYFYLDVFSSVL